MRLNKLRFKCTRVLFQSTHPCGVRRPSSQLIRSSYFISIHAPLWGATFTWSGGRPFCPFRSTHPCWVRRFVGGSNDLRWRISIHAPVLGAKTCNKSSWPLYSSFQSTHLCGLRQRVITLLCPYYSHAFHRVIDFNNKSSSHMNVLGLWCVMEVRALGSIHTSHTSTATHSYVAMVLSVLTSFRFPIPRYRVSITDLIFNVKGPYAVNSPQKTEFSGARVSPTCSL